MGIDVLHVLRPEPRLRQRALHGAGGAFAVLRRGGNVAGVGCGAVARNLAVDARAAVQRMRQALQHQHAGALANHEAVAVSFEGTRGSRRRVVAG